MAAFMAVTFLVVVVQDIPLGTYLERVERERIVTALERDAFLLAGRSEDTLEAATSPDPRVVADAHRYRQASGARVVIVNAAGDSVVTSDDDQSAAGTSYRSRPEIATALSGDIATGQRHSVSLGTDLLYVAVPVVSGDRVIGAVRLTYPTQVVTDKVRGQLRTLWLVAGITVLLAGAVAFVLAGTVTRRLRQLRATTELLAEGRLEARAPGAWRGARNPQPGKVCQQDGRSARRPAAPAARVRGRRLPPAAHTVDGAARALGQCRRPCRCRSRSRARHHRCSPGRGTAPAADRRRAADAQPGRRCRNGVAGDRPRRRSPARGSNNGSRSPKNPGYTSA